MPGQSDLRIVEEFYQAFKDGNTEKMISYYHHEAKFSDPVFQNLNASEVKAMWSMLIERASGNLDINYSDIRFENEKVHVKWEAHYLFSKKKRKVHNIITAQLDLVDGKIINHIDSFDFWKWSRMALGLTGLILGFSPFLKNKVRKQSRHLLNKYMSEKI